MSIYFYIFMLFCIINYAHGMEKKEIKERMITVITSEGQEDAIPAKHLLMSEVIKNLQEDCSDSMPIPLPNISFQALPLIKQFLENSYVAQNKSTMPKIRQEALLKFAELNTQDKLYTVLSAAYYLNTPHLLNICMNLWAEKKYAVTENYSLPIELDISIARLMKHAKKLLDNTPLLVAQELCKQKNSLCVKSMWPKWHSAWTLALSSDCSQLAVGYANGSLVLYNTETMKSRCFRTPHSSITSLQFDGVTKGWSSSANGIIRHWDILARKQISLYTSPECSGYAMKYIPRHKMLVAGGNKGKLCIWYLSKEQPLLQVIDAHDNVINTIEASNNGSILASTSRDKTVQLWNIENNIKASLNYKKETTCTGFNYLSDKLACGLSNGSIALHDLNTSHEIFSKKDHSDYIYSVLFSDMHDTLCCSGSEDSQIKLWDIRTRLPVLTLIAHQKSVQSMAVDWKKNMLYSASHDQRIKIWDLRKFVSSIHTLRKEFDDCTINQVLLLEEADNAQKSLSIDPPEKANVFNQFSRQAQTVLLGSLNFIKSKK